MQPGRGSADSAANPAGGVDTAKAVARDRCSQLADVTSSPIWRAGMAWRSTADSPARSATRCFWSRAGSMTSIGSCPLRAGRTPLSGPPSTRRCGASIPSWRPPLLQQARDHNAQRYHFQGSAVMSRTPPMRAGWPISPCRRGSSRLRAMPSGRRRPASMRRSLVSSPLFYSPTSRPRCAASRGGQPNLVRHCQAIHAATAPSAGAE